MLFCVDWASGSCAALLWEKSHLKSKPVHHNLLHYLTRLSERVVFRGTSVYSATEVMVVAVEKPVSWIMSGIYDNSPMCPGRHTFALGGCTALSP